MLVYLLRHGRAASFGTPGVQCDEDRMLTPDGVRELSASLAGCRDDIVRPHRVFHSPYRRARESAEILASAWGFADALEVDRGLVPGGSPQAVMETIAVGPRLEAIALVTHEPFAGRLLALLLTGDPRATIPMDVGMLAAVEVEGATTLMGQLVFAKTIRR